MTDLITKAALRADPLMPHLLDILSQPASEGLTLAGGFGLRVKQAELEAQIRDQRTLIPTVPPARATQDLDLFLSIELWAQPAKGQAVRAVLDGLGYRVITDRENYQFGKQYSPITEKYEVKVDLLARRPEGEERNLVASDNRRVGKDSGKGHDGQKKQPVGLHGSTTPEAFAIDNSPSAVKIVGLTTEGTEVQATVFLPHPYASLNMKVRAAHDRLRAIRDGKAPKPYSEKHAFDVYVITAMMLQQEIRECSALAARYATDPMAEEIRRNAVELFDNPDGHGFTEALRQMGDLPTDFGTFWEALRIALGIISD